MIEEGRLVITEEERKLFQKFIDDMWIEMPADIKYPEWYILGALAARLGVHIDARDVQELRSKK